MELNVKNFEEPNKYAFKSDAYDEVLRAMQETVKQAIQFLERHGILEIKFKGSNTSGVRDFYKNADRDISVDELLNRYDMCFAHPIFWGLLL